MSSRSRGDGTGKAPAGERAEVLPLVSYLRDIGYEDLYLRREAPPSREQGQPFRRGRSGARTSVAKPPSASLPVVEDSERRPVPAAPEARAAELEALGQDAAGCRACRLALARQNVVFGVGDPHADLMLVGEGPGAQEDRQGEPFVGPAGQLLNKILQAIDLSREQVYIANVVKCRPPKNRDPKHDEVAACRGYLERQIELIQPKAILALGRVAANTLLGSESSIAARRGLWHELHGVPLRVTYHPAALLRNADLKRPTWEDVQVVRDRLQEA